MITGKKGFSWGVAAAVLLASAACTHKKAGGGSSASSDADGGGSPVAVQFTQEGGSGAAGSAGLALADVSGRTDFGGTLAVTSYNIELECYKADYRLQGGRMIVRSGETDCASTVTEITVADQHGLIAKFSSTEADVAAGQAPKIMNHDGPDLHQDLKLLLSGKADPNGTAADYTFTIKGIAAGDNTTGTNGGDTGAPSSVSVAGVALPDVEPTQASAWTSVTYAGGVATKSYKASVQANTANPCGSQADYAIELFGQTNATTAVKVAGGLGGVAVDNADERTLVSADAGALIDDCRGLSTNLYLKLSCTDKAPAATNKGTSYKIITIDTMIPSSPYEGQGLHTSHLCANSADESFDRATDLPKLTISDVFASAAPAVDFSKYYFTGFGMTLAEAMTLDGFTFTAQFVNGVCRAFYNNNTQAGEFLSSPSQVALSGSECSVLISALNAVNAN